MKNFAKLVSDLAQAVMATDSGATTDPIVHDLTRPRVRRDRHAESARAAAAFDAHQRTLWQRAKGSQAVLRERRRARAGAA